MDEDDVDEMLAEVSVLKIKLYFLVNIILLRITWATNWFYNSSDVYLFLILLFIFVTAGNTSTSGDQFSRHTEHRR